MIECRFRLGVDSTCHMPFFLCAFLLFPFARSFTPIISVRASTPIVVFCIPIVRRHSFCAILRTIVRWLVLHHVPPYQRNCKHQRNRVSLSSGKQLTSTNMPRGVLPRLTDGSFLGQALAVQSFGHLNIWISPTSPSCTAGARICSFAMLA